MIRIQETIYEDPESKTVGGIGTSVFIRIMLLANAYTRRWILPRRFWDAEELTKRTFGDNLPKDVESVLVSDVAGAMECMVEFKWIEPAPNGDFYISRSFNGKVDERLFARSARLAVGQD